MKLGLCVGCAYIDGSVKLKVMINFPLHKGQSKETWAIDDDGFQLHSS